MVLDPKKITYEEYQKKLSDKREVIKANPDYYGDGPPSKCNDYIWYRNFLKSCIK